MAHHVDPGGTSALIEANEAVGAVGTSNLPYFILLVHPDLHACFGSSLLHKIHVGVTTLE